MHYNGPCLAGISDHGLPIANGNCCGPISPVNLGHRFPVRPDDELADTEVTEIDRRVQTTLSSNSSR